MAYSRRGRSTRTGRGRVSGYSRVRSRGAVRTRRTTGSRRRSAGGGSRTVRLVIEQAAPTVAPVLTEEGRFAVPDKSVPKRAKF